MYRAPVQLDYEDEPECPCARKGRACDDGRCTNRAALQECLPTRCSSACRNQRFQRREWIEFALAKRGRMGYGVVALQDVDEGDFIMEYVGEVIDEEEKAERLRCVLRPASPWSHALPGTCPLGTTTPCSWAAASTSTLRSTETLAVS